MKKILVFIVSFLVGLGLFFWIIKWVGWKEIKEILFTFSGYKGLVIIGITLLIWLVDIWKWKFIFKSQGYNFSIFNLGEIIFASFALSYLFPISFFGGEAFKIYAFKKKLSLSWGKNLAVNAIEKLLYLSVLLLFLIFGLSSFLFLTNRPLGSLGIVAGVFIGILTLLLVIFYFKSFKKESILKWLLKFLGVDERKNNYVIEDFEKKVFLFFDFKKSSMWKGLGLTFSKIFLVFVRCWFLLFFLVGEVNILIALAILFFVHLSYIFPLPAKIGSSEIAQAFAFGCLGLGTATGITFSFILRGAEVLVALFGLIMLVKLGIKFLIGNITGRFKI